MPSLSRRRPSRQYAQTNPQQITTLAEKLRFRGRWGNHHRWHIPEANGTQEMAATVCRVPTNAIFLARNPTKTLAPRGSRTFGNHAKLLFGTNQWIPSGLAILVFSTCNLPGQEVLTLPSSPNNQSIADNPTFANAPEKPTLAFRPPKVPLE